MLREITGNFFGSASDFITISLCYEKLSANNRELNPDNREFPSLKEKSKSASTGTFRVGAGENPYHKTRRNCVPSVNRPRGSVDGECHTGLNYRARISPQAAPAFDFSQLPSGDQRAVPGCIRDHNQNWFKKTLFVISAENQQQDRTPWLSSSIPSPSTPFAILAIPVYRETRPLPVRGEALRRAALTPRRQLRGSLPLM
jgi:hypothetical protein